MVDDEWDYVGQVVVPGEAVSWKAPLQNRKTGITYSKSSMKNYENHVRDCAAASGVPMIDGPIFIQLTAIYSRPKRIIWKTRPMPRIPKDTYPDEDNILKSTQDGLHGVVFKNDAQVTDAFVQKRYAARTGTDEEPPRAIIDIWKWRPE